MLYAWEIEKDFGHFTEYYWFNIKMSNGHKSKLCLNIC